jgi:hypothetical protein
MADILAGPILQLIGFLFRDFLQGTQTLSFAFANPQNGKPCKMND